MERIDIKFFEIEYNWKDNLSEEKRTAIVTNAEYNPKTFPEHIDEQIFHYDFDEYYLGVLVNLGSVTYQDFIVYSFKEVASVLEDTKKIEITSVLIDIFDRIGIDTPSNFDIINKYVYDDVCETADKNDWNNSDVEIAFRRWIESASVLEDTKEKRMYSEEDIRFAFEMGRNFQATGMDYIDEVLEKLNKK